MGAMGAGPAWVAGLTDDRLLNTAMKQSMPFYGAELPLSPQEANPGLMYFSHHGFQVFKQAVLTSVEITELLKIDEEEGVFTAKVRLTCRWYDSNFDTPDWAKKREMQVELRNDDEHAKEQFVTSYTAPVIAMEDVIEGEFDKFKTNVCEVKLFLEDDIPLGVCEAESEGVFTIRDDNPIYYFPFDRQELTLELTMPESKNGRDKDRYVDSTRDPSPSHRTAF